jgi:CheY-like chemotaxis protein
VGAAGQQWKIKDMTLTETFSGRSILVVEDDFFIAFDLATSFEEVGAQVVGPAATLPEALELVSRTERLDGAVLDIDLQGQPVYELVDKLRARGVPIILASGYDRSAIPERYADLPLCQKPFDLAKCAKDLFS